MPRPGELTYFTNIGEERRLAAINKPFDVNPHSPQNFINLGMLFFLLPPPPGRVLECGCGTGWLTYFLARKGYDCVGTDVSAEAIALARANPYFLQTGKVNFLVSDYERMDFRNEFDGVIFYDALHHAIDEQLAIQKAYDALKPGGVMIAIEPGTGHKKISRPVIEKYDVGDKDMPPYRVIRCGRKAGFRKHRIYQHPGQLAYILYDEPIPDPLRRTLFKIPLIRYSALMFSLMFFKRYRGAVWMQK